MRLLEDTAVAVGSDAAVSGQLEGTLHVEPYRLLCGDGDCDTEEGKNGEVSH